MIVVGVILFVVVGIIYFYGSYKPFGHLQQPQKFENRIPTVLKFTFKETMTMLYELIFRSKHRKPAAPLPVQTFDFNEPIQDDSLTIRWLGHSAVYMTWHKKRILIDPMFGSAPSPFPWFGNQRFSKSLPFSVESIDQIDVVFFSHDHYDHLDYGTIQKIKHCVRQFVVPQGVAAHLIRWGVPAQKIIECQWHEHVTWGNFTFVATPARHFSGRHLLDRNKSLWCSWVIKDAEQSLFFSGDSGYGPHFKEIGEQYGPFDWALMECGQYDERWAAIHMLPEQTVQAAIDVNAKNVIPIHWGGFILSLHHWYDPIERVVTAAFQQNLQLLTPQIGEPVHTTNDSFSFSKWWRDNI